MANGAASRGGWNYPGQPVTRSLLEDPYPQRTLRGDLLLGCGIAARQKVHAGPEYRNFRRSHRIERCRAVVGGPRE